MFIVQLPKEKWITTFCKASAIDLRLTHRLIQCITEAAFLEYSGRGAKLTTYCNTVQDSRWCLIPIPPYDFMVRVLFNPYPANVDNMASSYQC
jgi:hypothetical protein